MNVSTSGPGVPNAVVMIMISARVVTNFLKGLDFPATKERCLNHLARKRAPEPVLDAVRRMPGEKYETEGDFWRNFAAAGRREAA